MVEEIRVIHAEHRGNCGVLCIHAELRGFGHTVNRKRVARLMVQRCSCPCRWLPRPTPSDPRGRGPGTRCAPYARPCPRTTSAAVLSSEQAATSSMDCRHPALGPPYLSNSDDLIMMRCYVDMNSQTRNGSYGVPIYPGP
ncbi:MULTISPECIES: IS3 family transposase [unclassified Streptomyces]|uniref:IS3 family transposase n=1 Tax=unclassified Streptomyces TaxID=2593676 RepID=UPI0033B34D31